MDEKKLQKFGDILKLLDDSENAKKADVAEALAAFLPLLKQLKDDYTNSIGTMGDSHTAEIQRLDAGIASINKIMASMKSSMDSAATKSDLASAIETVKSLIPDMPEEVDEQALIDKACAKCMEDMVPETPDQVVKKINTADLLINKDQIQGLDELEKRIKETNPRGVTMFGARGIQLYVDGAKKGMVNMINLVPGSGISLVYSSAYGRNDITISASGGGGFSILTATGTVDDSNKAFTFISKPSIVVVNGASYQENNGWSWSGSTATLDFAPGTGGNVYAISS